MTLSQTLIWTQGELERAGIEDARLEARELVAALCSFPRGQLDLHRNEPFRQETRLRGQIARRIAGEPLQYILGEWDFMNLRFRVGEGVLIPRPETELLVEFAVERCGGRPLRIADLCSGSGCVGISVAGMCPAAHVWLVEKSPQAFAYLQENIRLNAVPNVTAVHGDIFDPVLPEGEMDGIVANPPYIPSGELPGLQREVRREPMMALDGGADGLDFYRRIARYYSDKIKAGGFIGLEFGDGQEEAVLALFRPFFRRCEIRRDLCGIPRVLLGEK